MASYADERQARIADQGKCRLVPAGNVRLGRINNFYIEEALRDLDSNLEDTGAKYFFFSKRLEDCERSG